jgi:hypothetical protein
VAEEDRGRDREGGGRVVTREAWVGGVSREKVDAARVDDEGPRPIDEFGDHLADCEGQTRAQHRSHRRSAPGKVPGTAGSEEDHSQGGDEECLGYVDVEEQGVLDAVVVVEKVV